MQPVNTPTTPDMTNVIETPGPKQHWPYQHTREIEHDPLGLLLRLEREYGEVVKYRVAFWNVFIINAPEGIKRVLVDNVNNYTKKNIDYQILKRILGEGLLTSEGAFWRRQRRMIQTIFTRQRIASYATQMLEEVEAMQTRWQPWIETGESFDLAEELMKTTLNIAGKTLFGLDLLGTAATVGHSFRYLNEYYGSIDLWMMLFGWLPTTRNRKARRYQKQLDQLVLEMIASRQKQLDKAHPPKEIEDLLTLLLCARDEETGELMSPQQVRDEVMTLVLAGHETTSNAMAWTLYELSRHPEVTERVQAELDEVLAGRSPTIEDLPKLTYCNMVLEESMRLHPPAWGISRQTEEDDVVLGHHIPANSVVIISPYATQRSYRYWEEPDTFKPERFMDATHHKYSYFPFGGGMRMCIGKHFAMTEMLLMLASLCERLHFHCEAPDDIVEEPVITLRPLGGLPMSVTKRDR